MDSGREDGAASRAGCIDDAVEQDDVPAEGDDFPVHLGSGITALNHCHVSISISDDSGTNIYVEYLPEKAALRARLAAVVVEAGFGPANARARTACHVDRTLWVRAVYCVEETQLVTYIPVVQ